MTTIDIAGSRVGRVGFGTMQLTGPRALGEPSDPGEMRRVLRTAVESGVRLIDTSGYYGPGVANRLVAEALRPYATDLLIATKIGAVRTPDGGFVAAVEPAALRAAVHDNLRTLRVERLQLVHVRNMPDAPIPYEETVGVVADLRAEGLIDSIGVSNVSVELLDQARGITEIASVENEFHLGDTSGRAVLDHATELGIPFLAFRPLGNGGVLAPDSRVAKAAATAGVAPAALALAWALEQSPGLAVIPGTSSRAHLRDNLAADAVVLDGRVRAELAGE
ncbi:aldo/keto reductase [Solicola gregarius]|uniref:Aldo/keto reductase n=1 Tax=Solicola gregarius TaxID=2908642 RepID=A0AA46YLM7_9ACTN|nr:aldo/keto reductase [Solicola gregarius]UYM07110.1 aldo/keto reductase [Solicola gregarius]